MNKIKHLPKSLPDSNLMFDIDVEGEITKHRYQGSFECQIPNLRMQTEISKYKAYLNGSFGESLDAHTKNLHHMTSYCKVCLMDSPEWFVDSDWGLDLYDQNALESVYLQILLESTCLIPTMQQTL